jgi:hypothetical protein
VGWVFIVWVLCFVLSSASLSLVFCVCPVFACVMSRVSCHTHAHTAQILCQDYTISRVQGTQYSTGPRLGRQKTVRWKIDCEMKEGRAQDSFFVCLLSKPFIIIGC